jgi:hypothetical protein
LQLAKDGGHVEVVQLLPGDPTSCNVGIVVLPLRTVVVVKFVVRFDVYINI